MDISISLTLPTRHNNDDDTKMWKYGEKITEKGILHTYTDCRYRMEKDSMAWPSPWFDKKSCLIFCMWSVEINRIALKISTLTVAPFGSRDKDENKRVACDYVKFNAAKIWNDSREFARH